MKTLNTIISRIEEVIVGIALSIATAITFIEVVLRYGFGSSLGFTHELAVYLLIITGLIGAAIGVREKVHIGVDIVIQQYPYPIQKAIKLITYFLCIAFCAIITVLGFMQVNILQEFGLVSPEMEIPMYIPISIVPISFGLMTVRFIQEFITAVKTPANEILQGGEEFDFDNN